jgi:cobalt/nickel transport protein
MAIVAFNFSGEPMKNLKMTFLTVISIVIVVSPAWSHFGMLIPSDSMVMQNDSRSVTVTLSFSHPFELVGMDMAEPEVFSVVAGGMNVDLQGSLEETRVMGHQAWKAAYPVKRPGVYLFYMEPQPYWEAAEDSFIIHYTKTVIAAFGDDEGWDAEIGLKTEIVPLSRPYEVEVEYYNRDQKLAAPTDYMITQTIKADGSGVFTYAAPVSGWWGFAALNAADYKLPHEGVEKDVELGAVIWVYFHKMN